MSRTVHWHVGVIHATRLSHGPIATALERALPAARVRHLLDDSLLPDLQHAGGLTPALQARMERLVAHLLADGIDVVQLACSGFASVVDDLNNRVTTPVLTPDEAMYTEVARTAYRRIGVLATVQPALDRATSHLARLTNGRDDPPIVVARCHPPALDAGDDRAALARELAWPAAELVSDGVDVLVLAQYSMAPAAEELASATNLPVCTGPDAAARKIATYLPHLQEPSRAQHAKPASSDDRQLTRSRRGQDP